ncbi:hypothetical protein Tco_1073015, partial [Tanacetum coccineum]
MQRAPLFESDGFIYKKNIFETYVKSKYLDLWHVITNGDFQPTEINPITKKDEIIPFEKKSDDLKKRLGNSQVKDNKIDLLVQQYEQFVIPEDESIDNAFARFNTITTSLKALNKGFSSKKYVRKFLRAPHPKWKAKVMKSSDEESLTSKSEDEEYAMAVRDFKKFFKRRDAETQIISSENVQNCRDTRTNGLLLEVIEVTAVKKMMKRPKTKTCLMAQASSE